MEILSQEQEQNQVQEPIRGTVRGNAAEAGQLLLVANVEHLPGQIRGPVPNKKEREQGIRHLRGKRSLEIQRYLNTGSTASLDRPPGPNLPKRARAGRTRQATVER
jgi:hypothetical protein